ncbi:C-terminal domain of homeodomain 1-domain-containing protein [Boletus coccyginus]|nr:C-terminal domain of homeodomain 1-domain-containing protein [Boletus coccyginus]
MALLQDDCWPAIFRDDVGCGAVNIETHLIPSRSDHIASCFLELERLNQELKSKLRDDFVNILNGMGGISLSSTPQPPSPSPTPPSRSSSLTHGTSFISEAHSWLLENIANPYPSSTVKASLAQRHNCSLSAINSWFVNARRRMGWTALCRDSFNNCRADALDAAYRALVKEDPNRQLPADIIHAFVGVKVAAEELYSSTLTKSAFASDLDTVVKDMSDREGVPVNEQNCSEPEGTMELSKVSSVDPQGKKLVNCYLSPDQSPSSSPPAFDESLSDESDEDIPPPTLAGRKRRFSSEGASESATRLVKRSRPNPSIPSLISCLPSPATSAEEFLESDQIPRPIPIAQSSTNSRPRRRRLSDADTTRLPKRPRDSMAGPPLHAVPDPLPLTTLESERSIDEWFKTNFDALFALPPPVDVTEPDHSTQWEVELFNNYIIPEDPQKTLTPSIQDNRISSSTDLTTLDDLLQSLESGGFVAPPEIMHPPAMAPFPVSQGLPSLPDLSQSIDWTALLNEDPFEPNSDPVFCQSYLGSALPEIDLSILQLPQVWTVVAS